MTAGKVLGIGQPTYLPWLGYLDLMDRSDEYVILDNVQFVRHSWQQRNRVKGPNGEVMLTVPVRKTGLHTTIGAAEIEHRGALRKHATTIRQAYAKAPHRQPFLDALEPIYADPPAGLLDLNLALLHQLRNAFGITTPLVLASSLDVSGHKDDLVRSICDARLADVYLSAPGSRAYIEAGTAFTDGRVGIRYHRYDCVPYPQLHGPFLPSLSAVDAVLNTGPDARRVLLAGRTSPSRSSGS